MRVASKKNLEKTRSCTCTAKSEPNWDLVKKYLPLLKSITGKVLINIPNNIDRESFYTIGLLGLISASKTFKQTDYTSFSKYATIKIRGALLDELRHLDWLSRGLRQKIKLFKQKIECLKQNLGRPPLEEEICNYLHLSRKEVEKLRFCLSPQLFIPLETTNDFSEQNQDQKTFSFSEKLADTNQISSRDFCEQNELKQLLITFLKEMPEMIQQIFVLHYVDGLFFSELATIFNLSESRICQLHTKTLAKLRKKLQKIL